MAGTTRNYDIVHMHQGPGDLWIIGNPPVDSASPQLTLASDGTPDATAHANSIHMGGTDSAITIVTKPKIEAINIDQADGPVDDYLVSQEMSIEAELVQLDPALMQNAVPYGVYSTQTGASGYKQLTFGGQALSSTFPCIACIAPKRAAPGKYIVAMLFKARGSIGLSTTIGRSKKTVYKAQFDGRIDLTRSAGRQMGIVYETL
jgi:hypothetical protein